MAPALAKGSVAPVATVALGLVTACLWLLLLLLLCSFFHRASRRFSTQERKDKPELVRVARMARLGSSDGRAALQGGIPSVSESQQGVDGPEVPGDPNSSHVGDSREHMPGWTPHSHALSGPALRTPEFLRHRQLPVLPGDISTAAEDPVPDAEGRIYESIRYKPGMLEKTRDAGNTPGDFPSLSAGYEPGTPVLEVITQEEPGSEGSPVPVYAQVRKSPRVPQPRQPQEEAPPQEETPPQEEAPPPLPEKHFDMA